MRTFDSPLSMAAVVRGIAVAGSGRNKTEAPPFRRHGMLQLVNNYASQISQHFAANHLSKGWGVPELISYTFDEAYNFYHSKDIGGDERIYEIISAFNAAINSSNSALSATWDPSTFPVRTFLTDAPHCQEQGDNPYFTIWSARTTSIFLIPERRTPPRVTPTHGWPTGPRTRRSLCPASRGRP